MEHAMLLMGGISLTIVGLSYLFRAREWDVWLQNAEKDGERASLIFGSINLLLGSFILAFHPVWEGIPLILTVIGIIAAFKGSVYLLFPQWLPIKLRYIRESEKNLFQISGVILAIIGVILLYAWFERKDIRLDNIIQTQQEYRRGHADIHNAYTFG